MIIGGGMAYTFLKVSQGSKIGNSLYDEEVSWWSEREEEYCKWWITNWLSIEGSEDRPRTAREGQGKGSQGMQYLFIHRLLFIDRVEIRSV